MSDLKRKQQPSNTTSFKGEFSFVNKDASNIDAKDHNAAVSWHVMNRYEKWKKQEQAKKLRTPANDPTHPKLPTQAPSSGASPQPQTGPIPGPLVMENAEFSLLSEGGSSHTQFVQAGPSSFAVDQPGLSWTASVTPASSPENTDVSNVASISVEFPPLVARILSYAYGIVIPAFWPNENGRSKWAYEISRSWDDLAAINGDPCYASATLCFYATLMASATNDRDLASQACFFHTQAMTELRQRVTQSPGSHDAATLKAILRLFSAETSLDNTSTARVHLKMLRKFVNSAGGVTVLESWFRENLLAADCYFALKYETRPLFPASEWAPGPLIHPWKARLAAAKVMNDHAPSVDSAIEHATLRSIVTDLRELFRVESYISSHDLVAGDQLLRWRQLRKSHCVSRLADHQLSVKIFPHLYLCPKFQLAVCAGIALMTALVMGSPEPVRFGLKLVTELRPKLTEATNELAREKPDMEDETDPSDALYWLLYVGMLGEQTHPVPQSARWFQQEFESTNDKLNRGTFHEQHKVVRNFLFSPALFQEVVNGRSQRVHESKKGVYESCGTSWRNPHDAGGTGDVEQRTEE